MWLRQVYKGIQAGTGLTVAVKRAQEGSKQGAAEFKNEIELLSRVHHNNLVGLVGTFPYNHIAGLACQPCVDVLVQDLNHATGCVQDSAMKRESRCLCMSMCPTVH